MDKIDVVIALGGCVLVAGIALFDPRVAVVAAGAAILATGFLWRLAHDREQENRRLDEVMRQRGETAAEQFGMAGEELVEDGGQEGDAGAMPAGRSSVVVLDEQETMRGLTALAAPAPQRRRHLATPPAKLTEAEYRKILEEAYQPHPRRMGPRHGPGGLGGPGATGEQGGGSGV